MIMSVSDTCVCPLYRRIPMGVYVVSHFPQLSPPVHPFSMELSTRNPQLPANDSLLPSATGGYAGYAGYAAGGFDAEGSGTGVASVTGGVTGGHGMSSMTESMGRTMAAVVRASGVAGNRSPAGRRAYPASVPITAATPLTPPRSSRAARGVVAEGGDAPVISGSQPVWAEAFPVTPSKISKETVVVRDVRDVGARHADTVMGGVNEPLRVSSAEHWLEVEGMDRGDHVTSLRHEDTPLAGASSAAARRVDRRRQFESGGRIEQGPGVVVVAVVAESKKAVSAGVERVDGVDGVDGAASDMSALHHHDDSRGPSATIGRAANRMPEVLPVQHSSPWDASVLAPKVPLGRGIEYGRDEGRPITVGGGSGGGVQDRPMHVVAVGHGTPGGLLSQSEAEHAFPAPSSLPPSKQEYVPAVAVVVAAHHETTTPSNPTSIPVYDHNQVLRVLQANELGGDSTGLEALPRSGAESGGGGSSEERGEHVGYVENGVELISVDSLAQSALDSMGAGDTTDNTSTSGTRELMSTDSLGAEGGDASIHEANGSEQEAGGAGVVEKVNVLAGEAGEAGEAAQPPIADIGAEADKKVAFSWDISAQENVGVEAPANAVDTAVTGEEPAASDAAFDRSDTAVSVVPETKGQGGREAKFLKASTARMAQMREKAARRRQGGQDGKDGPNAGSRGIGGKTRVADERQARSEPREALRETTVQQQGGGGAQGQNNYTAMAAKQKEHGKTGPSSALLARLSSGKRAVIPRDEVS